MSGSDSRRVLQCRAWKGYGFSRAAPWRLPARIVILGEVRIARLSAVEVIPIPGMAFHVMRGPFSKRRSPFAAALFVDRPQHRPTQLLSFQHRQHQANQRTAIGLAFDVDLSRIAVDDLQPLGNVHHADAGSC